MVFELSRRGLLIETELPFNNNLRIDIATGWEAENHTFDVEKNTHLWIVFCATDLLENVTPAGRFAFHWIKPGYGEIGYTFHDALCRGLWNTDKQAPFNDPVMRIPTWKSHFYDPDTGTNWMGETEPTAVSEGKRFYRKSLRSLQRGNLEKAGFYFGLALHYLGDITQPMHAANFTWLDSQPFGYHTDFERYVKAKRQHITTPTQYCPRLPDITPEHYLHTVARYTKDTYYRLICRPEWTQNYGDEARSYHVWDARVGFLIAPILADAILLTAQFILMWAKEAHCKIPSQLAEVQQKQKL